MYSSATARAKYVAILQLMNTLKRDAMTISFGVLMALVPVLTKTGEVVLLHVASLKYIFVLFW